MSDPHGFTAHDAAEDAAEDAAFYRAVLHELIHAGVDAARVINAKVAAEGIATANGDAPAGAGPVVELAAALDQVARMIRRTIRMAQWVCEPRPARRVEDDGRAVARRRIVRVVENRIAREAPEAERAGLRAELLERLDGPDLDEDLRVRPVSEVIDELCRDFGLERGLDGLAWPRRTPADVAEIAAVAARPSGLRAGMRDGQPAGADAGWGGQVPPFWKRE